MQSKELNLLMVKEFPEIKKSYDDFVSWNDGDETGSHVVYHDVLGPFMETALQGNNWPLIERLFSFLEKLLLSEDEYAENVLYLSFFPDAENLNNFSLYLKKYNSKVIEDALKKI